NVGAQTACLFIKDLQKKVREPDICGEDGVKFDVNILATKTLIVNIQKTPDKTDIKYFIPYVTFNSRYLIRVDTQFTDGHILLGKAFYIRTPWCSSPASNWTVCQDNVVDIRKALQPRYNNKEKAKHTNRHQSELYMILIALGLFGCGIIITIVVLVANEKYHLEDLVREMIVRHWYKCYQNVIKVTKISPSSPKDGTKRIQRLFHEYS
ncbi:hypothetical protein LSH36_2510g00006, partial [Paralvinella palmiformis]